MLGMRRSSLLLVALLTALVTFVALGQSSAGALAAGDEPAPALPLVRFFPPNGETVSLTVEVADTPELTQCGLMHRTSLPEDQGMLFVYEGNIGFWNRNTLIPLSVAYLSSDGRIVDILPMEATPFAGAPGVSQPDPREPYSFVIEANAGWFERHGIGIGDFVDVVDAVARGSVGQALPWCRVLGY
ncbi:MAG: DUF192 domain-containing protein [Dehalococcoidia bacterium]